MFTVNPKFDSKITYQENTNFPVGALRASEVRVQAKKRNYLLVIIE
jgi:hypothetical protein